MVEQNQNEKKAQRDYRNGLALTFGLHTIFGIVMPWLLSASNDLGGLLWLVFIGVTQLTYMIPAIGIAYFKRKPHIVKGLLIGAAITFLLNAACTGLFFVSNQLNQL